MPELARLGHVELLTPDLEASQSFFVDVIGLDLVLRDDTRAYLRAWGDTEHHTLVLQASDRTGVDHVGWRTRKPDDVDTFAEQLRTAGATVVDVPRGTQVGHGHAVRVTTPAGFIYELYYEVEKAPRNPRLPSNSGRQWSHGMSPRRFDHINVSARDVQAERDWSAAQLGFSLREFLSDGAGGCRVAWMAVSPLAHDLAVGPLFDGSERGLHHLSYFVDSPADVLRAADILSERGISIDHGPGRHAVSQAVCLYVRDPGSNHRVEIYSGSYLVLDPDWEPIEWRPQDYHQWWGSEIDRDADAPMTHSTPW